MPSLFELYWYIMCCRLINSTATTMNLLLSLWMTLSSRASSWLLLCSYFYFEDNYYCLLYIPNYSVNDDRKIRKPTRHQRDDITKEEMKRNTLPIINETKRNKLPIILHIILHNISPDRRKQLLWKPTRMAPAG
mmetsp:Transcript_17413/g.19513  ORF Transcript_17413/g.19513 Transcript_17413/m.19513 type:complete len:134 (-) Transcript_17413:8-409(-)